MSTAATAEATDAPPAKKGLSKKLIIIVAAVLAVLLVGGGGAAFFIMKKQAAAAAAAEEGADGEAAAEDDAHAKTKHDDKKKDEHAAPPTFVPLEPFVVNLADPDEDHYLQVGLTFELAEAQDAERVKTYMPAIRNAILLVLAHKTSTELLEQQGKEKLADEIRIGAARAMGVDVAPTEEADDGDAEAAHDTPKKKKKKKPEGEPNPITHVHYANFIIQ